MVHKNIAISVSLSADMKKLILVFYRYRPIRKLYLSAFIGIGRYEKRLIGHPLRYPDVGKNWWKYLIFYKIIAYKCKQMKNKTQFQNQFQKIPPPPAQTQFKVWVYLILIVSSVNLSDQSSWWLLDLLYKLFFKWKHKKIAGEAELLDPLQYWRELLHV